jgi:hypothetical protein
VINVERESATMQDFIAGRLTDDEHRAFEDRLVREPQLVRELEQSLQMREGLQQLRTRGYFGKAAPRARRLRIWVPALVAAAGAGLALFLWLPRVSGPPPILMASLASRAVTDVTPLVTAHFTFVSMRGGSAPNVDLPPAGLIEIRAAPTTRQAVQRYRVTLVRQEEGGFAESVAALDGLVLSTDGYVHCYADASRLTPGSYVLRIQPGSNSPGLAEEFPFNLRAGNAVPSR